MKKTPFFALCIALILAACTLQPVTEIPATPIAMTAEVGTVLPDGSGTKLPDVTQISQPLVPTELKYRVLEQFPDFFFCDPDLYPIARADEPVLAQQEFPALQANSEEFQAILAHHGFSGATTFTDEQKLLIYREHKKLNAIVFEPAGDQYKFQIQTGAENQQGSTISATIDKRGSISVLQKDTSIPTCPICLAAGTLIDTPRGAVRVEDLRVGDSVWTANDAGERVAAILLQTGHVRVPSSHEMVHVTLQDGRELWVSAGHPTADGRRVADLRVGDVFDGAQVIGLENIPYRAGFTFDILPSGATGFYWANGILLGSTLKK